MKSKQQKKHYYAGAMFAIEPPYTQTPGSTIKSRENPLITIQRSKSLLFRQ